MLARGLKQVMLKTVLNSDLTAKAPGFQQDEDVCQQSSKKWIMIMNETLKMVQNLQYLSFNYIFGCFSNFVQLLKFPSMCLLVTVDLRASVNLRPTTV